ncbi:hypothetical protein NDU88_004177 [Pleurodeles waltl]|uniref:Uncharacterized protein n=1 Tax=Pleurodeles waltl TaxID=8319 RepID=A0AAV7NLI9_PLEWA|nr:hypothetical protein NDU88_004177 [Pleurodeles waltl]
MADYRWSKICVGGAPRWRFTTQAILTTTATLYLSRCRRQSTGAPCDLKLCPPRHWCTEEGSWFDGSLSGRIQDGARP